GRPNDKIGVAGIVESLSAESRAYFAAGGLGILIGDGQLNYRREQSSKRTTPTASTNGRRSPSTISSSTIPDTMPTAGPFRSFRADFTPNSDGRRLIYPFLLVLPHPGSGAVVASTLSMQRPSRSTISKRQP